MDRYISNSVNSCWSEINFFSLFQGMDVVRKIESTRTNARDKPEQDVTIANTRVEENLADPIAVTKDDAK